MLYVSGPVLGGVLSFALGFETALRLLALADLLHAALLYRTLRQFPLSEEVACLTSFFPSLIVDTNALENNYKLTVLLRKNRRDISHIVKRWNPTWGARPLDEQSATPEDTPLQPAGFTHLH
ncbi:unnamed protein product [Colias eurytheme]|nr:unnamed protein product [Colias eurytheme]